MASAERVLNINVGVLGHVDSGKTSLAKALSTEVSTAALDRNPQSQERGITLDLGFSAFTTDVPEHLKDVPYTKIRFTLVDCPGHASLIRTIIGGAQIIDIMLLVVDITKGIQTQTAECLIIGEILSDRMIVVLNKVDKLKPEQRDKKIVDMKTKLRKVFGATKFGADVPMVCTSADPGSTEDRARKLRKRNLDGTAVDDIDNNHQGSATSATAVAPSEIQPPDVQELIDSLTHGLTMPQRSSNGPFLFAIDHCFRKDGQGAVMTGTVLSGKVDVGQVIEIPGVGADNQRKVKSMQSFRKAVQHASQGDRVALCVPQVDPSLLERGIACQPGYAQTYTAVIAAVTKIRHFKDAIKTKDRFHISIGHATVMATAHFFATFKEDDSDDKSGEIKAPPRPALSVLAHGTDEKLAFDFSKDYEYREVLKEMENDGGRTQYVVLEFDKPVVCPPHSALIGSRLDADINLNKCRLAFSGVTLSEIDFASPKERERLRVFKHKERAGAILRIADDTHIIIKDLFKKETDISAFVGKKITLQSNGKVGIIEGTFGTGGKCKAYFPGGFTTTASGDTGAKVSGGYAYDVMETWFHILSVVLKMKKYIYSTDKKEVLQD